MGLMLIGLSLGFVCVAMLVVIANTPEIVNVDPHGMVHKPLLLLVIHGEVMMDHAVLLLKVAPLLR
jgi:hypothetical protein